MIRTLLSGWFKRRDEARKHRHALVGPAHLWKMKRDFQYRFLIDRGLQPIHFLLDIGCGTLRGGIPLIRYLEVGHYFGFDVRDAALREGRLELQEEKLEVKAPVLLNASDISELSIEKRFDFIWAFSVLIHMDDAILDRCLAFVSTHLAPGACFFANITIGTARGTWLEFPAIARSIDHYAQAAAKFGLGVKEEGRLAALGHVSGNREQDDQMMLRIERA